MKNTLPHCSVKEGLFGLFACWARAVATCSRCGRALCDNHALYYRDNEVSLFCGQCCHLLRKRDGVLTVAHLLYGEHSGNQESNEAEVPQGVYPQNVYQELPPVGDFYPCVGCGRTAQFGSLCASCDQISETVNFGNQPCVEDRKMLRVQIEEDHRNWKNAQMGGYHAESAKT